MPWLLVAVAGAELVDDPVDSAVGEVEAANAAPPLPMITAPTPPAIAIFFHMVISPLD